MARKWALLTLLVAVGTVATVGQPAVGFTQGVAKEPAHAPPSMKIPVGFSTERSIPIGEGRRCIVGDVHDEDRTYSHPYVYLTDKAGRRAVWTTKLKTPEHFFGGRVTHCLHSGNSLYVLLQLDTHPGASLNQDIASVVRLSLDSGAILAETPVDVPEAEHNYSAWVPGDDGLRQVGNEIVVVGLYRYLDTYDDFPFTVLIKM
jgi:hypothetical protein